MSQLNIRGLNSATCRAFKSQAAARGMTLAEYLTLIVSQIDRGGFAASVISVPEGPWIDTHGECV